MKPERWQQIDKILEAALEREEGQRATFLDQACGDDEALREKVEALLAAHKQGENFLEEPALEVAAEGLAKDQVGSLVGRQISSYKILSLLGAGGMGEVYRARDLKLEREVAIKVLPAEFAQDPERLARFEREAKLLAALNHPNIAAIYGLVEADGIRLLVLELVEGKTLAERLVKGPIPVEEALEVCRQIAEGAEAAHEKGIIHRDLKPANVKVTPEGKVKILDFGLAKAFEDETPVTDISQSPTLTEGMTRAGVILGTAAYMSPEQAKGKAVGKRADIWAFGCVLYECLTGKRAFEGETFAETLASILKGEPDWPSLPHPVPRLLPTLLHRSLEKDSNRRLRHMGDIRILMEEALAEPVTALPPGPSPGPGRQRRTMTLSLVALVGAVVGAALWALMGTSVDPPLLTQLVINPPSSAPITRHFSNDLAISPDGRLVIYRASQGGVIQLYLRSLDDLEATPIAGTQRAQPDFFFSPDAQSVVFQLASELKRVSLAGGPSVTLCELPGSLTGGNWGPDGTIVFSAGSYGIYRVAATGSQPESLAIPDSDRGEIAYSHPEVLPGGDAVLFSIAVGKGWQTATLSLETREKKILVEGARQAHYAPTGHLVYERAETGTLMAVPFDLAKLEISGDSTSILEGVRQVPSAGVDYAFSVDGTLVYVPSRALAGRRALVWVDREGRESLVMRGDREIAAPRLSPDGNQVAFTQMKDGSPESIWTYDLDRDSFNRVTFEGTQAGTVAWSRDGKWLAYFRNEDGKNSIYRQPVDGSAQPEQLTTSDITQLVISWSPDRRFISFSDDRVSRDVGILPTEGNGKPFYLIDSPANECCAMFSPDGNWLAYVSDESGRDQVYVRPFPEPDIKFLISQEGGQEPVWSPDGGELFYRSGDRMMLVSLQTKPRFAAGKPVVLFEESYLGPDSNPAGYQYYDISRDGQRFLMVREEEQQTPIHVVLNWFEELKRLLPSNN